MNKNDREKAIGLFRKLDVELENEPEYFEGKHDILMEYAELIHEILYGKAFREGEGLTPEEELSPEEVNTITLTAEIYGDADEKELRELYKTTLHSAGNPKGDKAHAIKTIKKTLKSYFDTAEDRKYFYKANRVKYFYDPKEVDINDPRILNEVKKHSLVAKERSFVIAYGKESGDIYIY